MSEQYERVVIAGRLICLTPLSIGGGEPPVPEAGADEAANVLSVCKDGGGLPYIPGSSLRGLLRSLLPEGDPHFVPLFGTPRVNDRDSRAGALRVYNARCARAGQAVSSRTRNSMDPVTGTTRDGFLYALEQVPAGSEFECRFELDRCGRNAVEVLLGLLATLDGESPDSRLGRGRTQAAGRVRWQAGATVEVLTPARLAKWLLQDGGDLPFEPAGIAPADRNGGAARRFLTISLRIRPRAPLLVDPRDPTSQEAEKRGGENGAVIRVEQRGGTNVLVVPASGLKGVLRAHCRKILLTLLVNNSPDEQPPYVHSARRADALVQRLFGHAGRAGAVIFEDATAPFDPERHGHTQYFNAVDRFTGGASDGALFWADAAVSLDLEITLCIDLCRLEPSNEENSPPNRHWWRGLLLLALRDALEGDLILGRGKAKGYGVVAVHPGIGDPKQPRYVESWDALLNAGGTDNLPARPAAEGWLKALHAELDRLAQEPNPPDSPSPTSELR